MNVKIHYRITQDRSGIPTEFTGARHVVTSEETSIEESTKQQLSADYQVPLAAVEIIRVES